jgi:hypothetical protein
VAEKPSVANANAAGDYQQRGVHQQVPTSNIKIYWLFSAFHDFSQDF